MDYFSSDVLANQAVKHRKLVFEFSITANATPANKVRASDLPGICILRCEGQTSDADAVEVVSFSTVHDNSTGNCVFGVLLKGTELVAGTSSASPAKIAKVLNVRVNETSTAIASALAVTKHGTGGLTTGGNIAFSIAGTGLALDTQSPKICVEVDYVLAK